MRKIIPFIFLLTSSCTLLQIQTTQRDIQIAIDAACAEVNIASSIAAPFSIVPEVGAVLLYAKASCIGATATADIITKAVNDPGTIAWVRELATKLRGSVAKVQAAPISLSAPVVYSNEDR